MKNLINFYYKLYPKYIDIIDDGYHFVYNGYEFVFKPFNRDLREQKLVFDLAKELLKGQVNVSEIVLNADNNIITEFNNLPHIMLKYVKQNGKPDILDVVNLQYTRVNQANTPVKWFDQWTKKIDYFEYQINEISQDYRYVYNSFTYYIGVWENGVSYLKRVLDTIKPTNLDQPCVNHRRISLTNEYNSFYDPVNFVIDHKSRDLSECLKYAFISGGNYITILDEYLSYMPLSNFGVGLLFARLLFPSFYFDIFQNVVEKRQNPEDLLPYLEITNDYELFIKDVYLYLFDKYKIEPVDWIMKNKKDSSYELS